MAGCAISKGSSFAWCAKPSRSARRCSGSRLTSCSRCVSSCPSRLGAGRPGCCASACSFTIALAHERSCRERLSSICARRRKARRSVPACARPFPIGIAAWTTRVWSFSTPATPPTGAPIFFRAPRFCERKSTRAHGGSPFATEARARNGKSPRVWWSTPPALGRRGFCAASIGQKNPPRLRLVRGSHVVTKKLFDGDAAFLFQARDGRIVFAIPFQDDFTLIGTTDVDQAEAPDKAAISADETDYLCRAASAFLARDVTPPDVVWSFSGVRPLNDEGRRKGGQRKPRLRARRERSATARRDQYSRRQADGLSAGWRAGRGPRRGPPRPARRRLDGVVKNFPAAILPAAISQLSNANWLRLILFSPAPRRGAWRALTERSPENFWARRGGARILVAISAWA